ncbi:streptomycin 6-kinase [Micromonospora sonneratiae]|uniref:Aminoglycoside phosphotransferase family protein n=1 Tax=Micromonospora sonneratiae TaxID=1184706 RepID=A0ABW3YCI3_9ACTN
MQQLPLPENLAGAAEQDLFPQRRAWIADLPNTVRMLVDRWELRLGAPFQPGGQCSWVAPARDSAGRELVLKVGWAHEESTHEVDALRLWNGDGAVLLHDAYAFVDTSALLLEPCRPGTTLGNVLDDSARDLVVADLLPRLWQAPAGGPFRPLKQMCDDWADEFDERTAATGPPVLDSGLDPGLIRAGIQLFRELPTTAERHVLLCTDLHAGNILAARRQPWLVIDPKPYVGDPTYDVLQHMLNNRPRLERDPVTFARRMAQLLDLDPGRLQLWLFARSVQESLDSPWLGAVAAQLRPS